MAGRLFQRLVDMFVDTYITVLELRAGETPTRSREARVPGVAGPTS